MLRWSGWLVIGTLIAAGAYELAVALGAASPGPEPGDDVAGSGIVLLLALLAILAATVLVFRCTRVAGLFAPAAAFFVTARFYTGDPYYAPTFHRYADGGLFSPAWIFLLLGLACLAGLTTFLWRRTAAVESAIVLLLLLFTALFMGTGH